MTDKSDRQAHVDALLKKASEAPKSDDAMRYAQAALNAANANAVLHNLK